jgi:hypothetical protein
LYDMINLMIDANSINDVAGCMASIYFGVLLSYC